MSLNEFPAPGQDQEDNAGDESHDDEPDYPQHLFTIGRLRISCNVHYTQYTVSQAAESKNKCRNKELGSKDRADYLEGVVPHMRMRLRHHRDDDMYIEPEENDHRQDRYDEQEQECIVPVHGIGRLVC